MVNLAGVRGTVVATVERVAAEEVIAETRGLVVATTASAMLVNAVLLDR